MNRRDFAKTSLGGLLALLVPGKVLAGPKFPRYFAIADPPGLSFDPVCYLEAVQADAVFCHTRTRTGRPGTGWETIGECETGVRRGQLREITAAEAKALLVPNRWWTPEQQYPLGTLYTAPDGRKWRYVKFVKES